MDRLIEQPFPPSLGRFPVARILWDIRTHPGIEDHLAIMLGIKATIKFQIGAVKL
jgi:hypothetical protein